MLPKKRRVERKDFQYILKEGKKYNSRVFLMYLAGFKGEKRGFPSKFSFSVSKKVKKNATDRNRLRRIGYSAVSKNLDKIKNDQFFFFIFKKSNINPNFSLVEAEIKTLLSNSLMLR